MYVCMYVCIYIYIYIYIYPGTTLIALGEAAINMRGHFIWERVFLSSKYYLDYFKTICQYYV